MSLFINTENDGALNLDHVVELRVERTWSGDPETAFQLVALTVDRREVTIKNFREGKPAHDLLERLAARSNAA